MNGSGAPGLSKGTSVNIFQDYIVMSTFELICYCTICFTMIPTGVWLPVRCLTFCYVHCKVCFLFCFVFKLLRVCVAEYCIRDESNYSQITRSIIFIKYVWGVVVVEGVSRSRRNAEMSKFERMGKWVFSILIATNALPAFIFCLRKAIRSLVISRHCIFIWTLDMI